MIHTGTPGLVLVVLVLLESLKVSWKSRKLSLKASMGTHTQSEIFRLVHILVALDQPFPIQNVLRFMNGTPHDHRQDIRIACHPARGSFVTINLSISLNQLPLIILRPSLPH